MNKLKKTLLDIIVVEAINLFLKKPISCVTMSDIAKKVGIGEATLYRYFKKKQNIVLASAIKLSQIVFDEFFTFKTNDNGYKRIEQFYNAYLNVFLKHQEYYYFINELDSYLLSENLINQNEYDNEIGNYKMIFDESYNLGINDKSIHKIDNIELFYYSTTHSLLSLCKKLSISKSICKQDNIIKKEDEIKTLIELILKNFK